MEQDIKENIQEQDIKENEEEILEEKDTVQELDSPGEIVEIVERMTEGEYIKALQTGILAFRKYIDYLDALVKYHKKKNKLYEDILKEEPCDGSN